MVRKRDFKNVQKKKNTLTLEIYKLWEFHLTIHANTFNDISLFRGIDLSRIVSFAFLHQLCFWFTKNNWLCYTEKHFHQWFPTFAPLCIRIVFAHCGGGCERWRMDGALMKGSVNIRRRNTHWVLSSHYTPEQTHLLTFLEPLSPSLPLCFLPTIFFLNSSGTEWQLLTSHTPSRHLSVTQDLFLSLKIQHTHTHTVITAPSLWTPP